MVVRRVVPNFHTTDADASKEFYVDFLGLDVVMDKGWIITFATPVSFSGQLCVLSEDATAPEVANMSIEVTDVDATYAEAQRRGYEIVHPLTDEEWGVRRFFVRDPNGAVVNLLAHIE
ncbi:MAG: VOC family protein [Sciscionella sp.]